MAIEMVPALPDHVVGFIAKGTIERDDYIGTIEPAIETALAMHDKISLLYVLGEDFEGYTTGAMWEDGELGAKHLRSFDKVAVVTDVAWCRHAVNLMGHLIPAKVKVYSVAEEADASEWVTA